MTPFYQAANLGHTMHDYTPPLVEAICIAQEKGTSPQDFLMDVTLQWLDCIQGQQIEKLIRKGHCPKEAAELIAQHSTV